MLPSEYPIGDDRPWDASEDAIRCHACGVLVESGIFCLLCIEQTDTVQQSIEMLMANGLSMEAAVQATIEMAWSNHRP